MRIQTRLGYFDLEDLEKAVEKDNCNLETDKMNYFWHGLILYSASAKACLILTKLYAISLRSKE